MAKKPSKSLLSSLKNMLHRDAADPPEPAPKKPSGTARKKPSEPAAAKRSPSAGSPQEQRSPASSADAATAQETASESKPDKKKPLNQPWYRHRQRW
jgi:hypothetical protein